MSDQATEAARHRALLAASPGYRQFVERLDYPPEDIDMVEAFADWLVGPHDLEEWADRTAEQFLDEWETWHS